jgi:hypothetical protein
MQITFRKVQGDGEEINLEKEFRKKYDSSGKHHGFLKINMNLMSFISIMFGLCRFCIINGLYLHLFIAIHCHRAKLWVPSL